MLSSIDLKFPASFWKDYEPFKVICELAPVITISLGLLISIQSSVEEMVIPLLASTSKASDWACISTLPCAATAFSPL